MILKLFFLLFLLWSANALSMDQEIDNDRHTYIQTLSPEENYENVFKFSSYNNWLYVSDESQKRAQQCYGKILIDTKDSRVKALTQILIFGYLARGAYGNKDAMAFMVAFESLKKIGEEFADPQIKANSLVAQGNLIRWVGPEKGNALREAIKLYEVAAKLHDSTKSDLESAQKELELLPSKPQPIQVTQTLAAPNNYRHIALRKKLEAKNKQKMTQEPKHQLTVVADKEPPSELIDQNLAVDIKERKPALSAEPANIVDERKALKELLAKENIVPIYPEPIRKGQSFVATVKIGELEFSGVSERKKQAQQIAAKNARKALIKAQAKDAPPAEEKPAKEINDIDVSCVNGRTQVVVKGETLRLKRRPKEQQIANPQTTSTKKLDPTPAVKILRKPKPPANESPSAHQSKSITTIYMAPAPEPKAITGDFPTPAEAAHRGKEPKNAVTVANEVATADISWAPTIPLEIKTSPAHNEQTHRSVPTEKPLSAKLPAGFVSTETLEESALNSADEDFAKAKQRLQNVYGEKVILKHIDPATDKILVQVVDNFVSVHILPKNQFSDAENEEFKQKVLGLKKAQEKTTKLLNNLKEARAQFKYAPIAVLEEIDDKFEIDDKNQDAFLIAISDQILPPYNGFAIPSEEYLVPETVSMLIVSCFDRSKKIRVIRNGLTGLQEAIGKAEDRNQRLKKELEALGH